MLYRFVKALEPITFRLFPNAPYANLAISRDSQMKRQLVLVALTVCAVLPVAQAQKVGETVATPFQGLAYNAKGAQLRDQVNDLVALVRAKRLPDAERKAIEC